MFNYFAFVEVGEFLKNDLVYSLDFQAYIYDIINSITFRIQKNCPGGEGGRSGGYLNLLWLGVGGGSEA